MDIKKAVILAGGFGERLRPLTDLMPKPMIPVNGRPVLWHLVNLFKKYGVKSYNIYLDDQTNDLFANVEVESSEQWEMIRRSPAATTWREYMQPLLKSDTDGNPRVVSLREVFSMETGDQ